MRGAEAQIGNDEVQMGDDEAQMGSDEPQMGSDEPQMGSDEPQMDSDEVPMGGDEPQMDDDELQMGGDEVPILWRGNVQDSRFLRIWLRARRFAIGRSVVPHSPSFHRYRATLYAAQPDRYAPIRSRGKPPVATSFQNWMPSSMASRRSSTTRNRHPKVALMIETSNAYARGVLAGVKAYLRSHGPWNVHLAEHGRGDRPPKWLADWDGDGILARVETKAIARALEELDVPVVDLSSYRHLPAIPVVTTDNTRIAELAFQHFREREFRHFAFCGVERFAWSLARARHFDKLVSAAGLTCAHYENPAESAPDSDVETDAIAKWLLSLPKPAAVFACYDSRGLQVLEACLRANLSVPDQIAVLGVDNDDLLCELSSPPLSSVIPDTQETGWKAAEILDAMLRDVAVQPEMHRVPPIGVCTRQSTDVMAVDDVHVARAARFIREHACEGIDVSDVVSAIPLGRRVLERRFRAVLGRTLREEISRVQMQRVMDLLVGTDLPLAQIADRTGFRHVEYLTVAFKREIGQPPSVYRETATAGRNRRR